MQTLTCAGNSGCTRAVAMIGDQGYTYCKSCGPARGMTGFERVRKLTSTERRRLEAGQTISYQRQSNPKALGQAHTLAVLAYLVQQAKLFGMDGNHALAQAEALLAQ
jgi:hypothetical protein